MAINQSSAVIQLCLFISISVYATNHCLTCTYGPSACHLSDVYDHCTPCPNCVEDANSDLEGFFYNASSAIRRLCHLGPEEEKCLLAREIANEIIQTLVDEVFPREPTEESIRLTCSQLLFYAKTSKDSKGKEIENGLWSCIFCELFLDHLFTVLHTSVSKVNKALTSILRPTKDADCMNVFSDLFQISGIFGEFIQNKRTE